MHLCDRSLVLDCFWEEKMMKPLWNGLVAVVIVAHSNVWAVSPQSSSSANAIGKALGMLLFAYLVLKWVNRKKDEDDGEPRGFLGLAVKPWVVWLVVIGGLGLLMARSG
jgi:hypothetical protein